MQPAAPVPQPSGSASAKTPVLSVEGLVQQVLASNPSLAQMAAAWQAARARYPQVTSLEDPMFAATVGPDTFAPDDPGVNFAYRLEVSQKYPWPGKLALRGENALAEASAAGNEVEDTRLQLIESAQDAFYEYYLVSRALEENEKGLRLLRLFRPITESRYKNPPREEMKVSLQDILQVDVEIGRQGERRLTLERMRQVAVARINTLMHLPPDAPLPPPPGEIRVADALPDAQVLRAAALARRPDLRALADRIRAEEASLALACKEYYPDFEPFAMYDRFMGNNEQNADLATMVGVRVNLPVRRTKRQAAVSEAEARIAQRRAQLERQVDQAGFQVQEAYEQVRESERIVRLYETKILSDARQNVDAARPAYETGLIPASSFIEAERSLVDLRDRYHEAVAAYFRRRATLERAVGGPLVP
jgi:outer membrane protein TolC